MKLDLASGGTVPTKKQRRQQIAARAKQEREEVRDDGPALREAVRWYMLRSERPQYDAATWLGISPIFARHAWAGHYVKLPAKANDGRPLTPKDRLDLFLQIGDPTLLPMAAKEIR